MVLRYPMNTIDPTSRTDEPSAEHGDAPAAAPKRPEILEQAARFSALLRHEYPTSRSATGNDHEIGRQQEIIDDDKHALSGRLQAHPRGQSGDDNLEKKTDPDKRTSGDRILRGLLFGLADVPHAIEKSTEADDADAISTERISELASAVAQRILVTDPSTGASQEVHIALKGDLLGGTEVRISQRHGELQIELRAPNPVVGQQLKAHTAQLQAALQTKLNAGVQVVMNVPATAQAQAGTGTGGQGTGQGNGQAPGQGAGQGTGQGGDGRSRNQRTVIDEWQPDDQGWAG